MKIRCCSLKRPCSFRNTKNLPVKEVVDADVPVELDCADCELSCLQRSTKSWQLGGGAGHWFNMCKTT